MAAAADPVWPAAAGNGNGTSGGGGAGGSAVTNGGAGGAGGGASAHAGFFPGGGGGGSSAFLNTGSAGAAGKVELIYTPTGGGTLPNNNVIRFIVFVPAHGGKVLLRTSRQASEMDASIRRFPGWPPAEGPAAGDLRCSTRTVAFNTAPD